MGIQFSALTMPPFSVADFSDAFTAYMSAHPVVEALLIVFWLWVAVKLGRRAYVRISITRQIHQIAELGRQSDEAHYAWIAHLKAQDAEAARIHRLMKPTPDPKRAA